MPDYSKYKEVQLVEHHNVSMYVGWELIEIVEFHDARIDFVQHQIPASNSLNMYSPAAITTEQVVTPTRIPKFLMGRTEESVIVKLQETIDVLRAELVTATNAKNTAVTQAGDAVNALDAAEERARQATALWDELRSIRSKEYDTFTAKIKGLEEKLKDAESIMAATGAGRSRRMITESQ